MARGHDSSPTRAAERFVYRDRLPAGPEIAACDFLSAVSGISKRTIKEVMIKGGVWHARGHTRPRRLRRATARLRPGDRIELYYDPALLNLSCPEPEMLHSTHHYSVWHKPSGLLAQGTRFADHCSLERFAQRRRGPGHRVFLVHRLDREAAGLMLVAHSAEAAGRLSELFSRAAVVKHYRVQARGNLALSHGASGRLDLPLDGKPAVTEFTVQAYDPNTDVTTLVAATKTGRLHQIRRHLHLVGHPVMGDPRYGLDNKNREGLRLVAARLSFACPFSEKPVDFVLERRLVPF